MDMYGNMVSQYSLIVVLLVGLVVLLFLFQGERSRFRREGIISNIISYVRSNDGSVSCFQLPVPFGIRFRDEECFICEIRFDSSDEYSADSRDLLVNGIHPGLLFVTDAGDFIDECMLDESVLSNLLFEVKDSQIKVKNSLS